MTRIKAYRLFGLCVALASGATMLQGCSDNNAGAGTTGTGGAAGASTGTGTPTTTAAGTTGTGTASSTGTGMTGTGGTGGGSKAVTYCTTPYLEPMPITSALISDFEGEAGTLIQSIMPGGIWAVDTDLTGTPAAMSMTIGPCGTTGNGIHFVGAGHGVWGADVATALVSQLQPVDVSAYTGISFVMKPAANTNLIFKVENPYAQPGCGHCVEVSPPLGAECYPGFIKNISLVANDATPIVVKWADLMQQNWGYRPADVLTFDPNNLISVVFAFDKNIDFDVCLDDVKFVQ